MYLSREIFTTLTCEIMTTLTFAVYDHSDPSGFIHVRLLFALCLVVIGLCLALIAAG